MTLEIQAMIVMQLGIAALLSALIGIERERTNHPAGMRTHMLVGVGSCLFSALSLWAFPAPGDPTRVASNIVVGIGFLGAGTIIKGEDGVRNLTTAASVWVTAAVGMAVGLGAWFVALGGSVLVWLILSVLHPLRQELRDEKDQPKKSESKVTDSE